MARAIWTGTISFGLVSIPVGLYSATADHTIHFHQFERGTSDRIRNQRVNERTGKVVEYSDIVKGTSSGRDGDDGEYVVVESEELNAVAPGRSREMEITDFVDLDEIDPIYFNRTYWLAPAKEEHARPYGLLLAAMNRTNRAAIGTLVMRGKEYLAAIRPSGKVLALETLFFADEVRDATEELSGLPDKAPARGKELDMATQLVESMAGPWRPEQYRDTYRDRVAELVEDKREGREVVTESKAPEATEVSDLLEALQRSVEARGGTAGKRGSRSKSAPSKSASAKSAPSKRTSAKRTSAKKASSKKAS